MYIYVFIFLKNQKWNIKTTAVNPLWHNVYSRGHPKITSCQSIKQNKGQSIPRQSNQSDHHLWVPRTKVALL